MSEIIEAKGLGLTVERTAEEFAAAIDKLHRDTKLYKQIKENLRMNRASFAWEVTLEPLVEKLVSLNVSTLKEEIIQRTKKGYRSGRLPLKSRFKRSAKILLLGQ